MPDTHKLKEVLVHHLTEKKAARQWWTISKLPSVVVSWVAELFPPMDDGRNEFKQFLLRNADVFVVAEIPEKKDWAFSLVGSQPPSQSSRRLNGSSDSAAVLGVLSQHEQHSSTGHGHQEPYSSSDEDDESSWTSHGVDHGHIGDDCNEFRDEM